LIDKKIVCELDVNCRIPLSILAKKLRIGRNVAGYRIKNLEKNGIISRYICSVNLGLLGYTTYKIYFKTRAGNEEKFRKYMEDEKRIIHFLKTEGAFDYSITIAVKTIRELDEFLMETKSIFGNMIRDYFVSILVYSRIFKLSKILLDTRQEAIKFERYSGEDKKMEIDEKDEKIIRTISQEANMPLVGISEKTRLSIDVVKYRLKQLTKNIVSSYRIMINLEKLGFHHYIIMLRTKPASKNDENKLIDWCTKNKRVLYCTKRIGNHDFEINAAISDIDELNKFISELKSELGEIIDSYDITINSKLLKLSYVPF